MADQKITDLAAINAATVASTDVTVVVDVSDTSMAASGTDKKLTVADLATAITTVGALATDAEVSSAISALSSTYQPLDSDLTAIAALTTTAYGRGLLVLADAAAGRTALSLGTAAVVNTGTGASDVPTITQADLRYQPIDSDLTSIAALTTTAYGRAFLALANQAALMALLSASSDTVSGIVELATTAETTTGTDTERAVTPAGLLNATTASNINARIGVEKAGSLVGTRRRINFIEGANVTLTVADDAGNEEVDVTIAASGGGGSVATDTIFDAKGDLPVGTGADTAAKLTVGANGQILAADSSATTGVRWLSDMRSPRGASGIYYIASMSTNAANTTVTLDVAYYVPIWLVAGTLDRLAIRMTTPAASNVARLGIYENDTDRAGTLLLDAGTVSLASGSGEMSITISQAVSSKVYWLACALQGGTSATIATGTDPRAQASPMLPVLIGQPGTQGTGYAYYTETGVSGALPATATPALTTISTVSPIVFARYA